MRDLMGFSQAPLGDGTSLDDLSYSTDRRYLLVLQANHILTFDLQTQRFIDGKRLTFGSDISVVGFGRPSLRLLRAPDDRLFLYASPSADAPSTTFIEILVSPTGELAFDPFLELYADSYDTMEETHGAIRTFLPDYSNDDGSYDLFFGQPVNATDTECRLIEDFVPPRRHVLARTLNVLSIGTGGVSIAGSKPGVTPYSAICTNAQSISLNAAALEGYDFEGWRGENGDILSTISALQLEMDVDRSVTAVYRSVATSGTIMILQ